MSPDELDKPNLFAITAPKEQALNEALARMAGDTPQLIHADLADVEARLREHPTTTTEPDLVLVTPEERARAKFLSRSEPTGMGTAALMAALITAGGMFDDMVYSHTLPGLPAAPYDGDAAAKLREERRLRKAANFAKRQPKGTK